jgi:hypothetical protein
MSPPDNRVGFAVTLIATSAVAIAIAVAVGFVVNDPVAIIDYLPPQTS